MVWSYESSKPFVIWGNGNQTRDFIHMQDITSLFKLIIENDSIGGIFNVGTGIGYSLLEIHKIIENIFMTTIPLEFNLKYREKISRNILEIEKVKNVFNWEPIYDVNQGLLALSKSLRN
jgi:UDP-glucose 4-epimerase